MLDVLTGVMRGLCIAVVVLAGWALISVVVGLLVGRALGNRDRLDALADAPDDEPLTVSERARFDEIVARL